MLILLIFILHIFIVRYKYPLTTYIFREYITLGCWELMITTVTTTTTTAVTAVSAQFAAFLGIIGTITLILLLIAKELLSSHEIDKKLFLSKNLNIAIAPFLMMFGLIVITKILSII